MSKLYEQLKEAVLEGNVKEASRLTQEALNEGNQPKDIIDNALVEAMNEVSALFKEGELYVPEVLMSAQATAAGMDIIKPLLKEGDVKNKGTVVFCTVKGDLHDIGKKLCCMLMESAGYKVVDLGVDVGPQQMIDAIKVNNASILGMSAMLTTTMVTMQDAVDALKENGLYGNIKVMVGGAPLSPQYAGEIGANYSSDATGAVELANRLMA